MSAYKWNNPYNQKNIIPCIIDYFISEDDIKSFVRNYRYTELVLISSREVYEYLVQNNCSLNIEHFPLSIADKYMFDNEKYTKKYDVVLAGRQSEKLLHYLAKYINMCKKELKILVLGKKLWETVDQTNQNSLCKIILAKGDESREKYMQMLRESKVMLYMTPNTNRNVARTRGWSQVTPRFLEGIVSQCHILCDYYDNADTEYFRLREFADPCKNFEEFQKQMDCYLGTDVDLIKYKEYLQQHLTSERVKLLKDILRR